MSLASSYFSERLGDKTLECDEGFITFKFMNYENLKAVYIRDIYVKPELRRNGIGTELGNAVVELAKKEKAEYVLGTVDMRANFAEDSMKELLYWGMKPCAYQEGLVWFVKGITKKAKDKLSKQPNPVIPFDESKSDYGNYIGERLGDEIIEIEGVGFATYKFMPYGGEEACYIKEIFTVPEKRGTGVADTLGKHIEIECNKRGVDLLVGTIDPKSAGNTYALYGFLWWGFQLNDFNNGVLWITKRISEPFIPRGYSE